MSAANPKEVRAAAAALGVALETTECMGFVSILADAPDGQRFASTQAHGVAAQYATGDETRKEYRQAWAALAADLAAGLEPCPADCECRDGN